MSDDIKNMLEEGAKRFAALEGNLETTQNRLKELEQMRERIAGSWSKDDSKRGFSFAAVLRGMAAGGLDAAGAWKGAEKEREAGVAARERALSVGTDSAGGYIVPEEYMAEIIEVLRAKVVAIQAGATQLNGLSGSPVVLPRQDTSVTAQWQNGENTSITASDQTLGQVSMSPKMATAMTKMSRRLVALSNPSVEAMVRADLVATIARLVDLAAFRGSGSSGQPTGIANTASIGTITSVGAIAIEDVYDALYELEKSNSPMNRVALVCHPRTWNQLRKLRAGGSTTGDGAFLLNPDPAVAVRGTVAGYPVFTSTQIPITLGGGTDTVAYFGDFSELILGQWGTMTLEATDSGGDAFAYHQLWVKAVMEMDVAVRHAKSFVELSGITA